MRASELQFDVSEDVLALGLRGVYFTLSDIKNRLSDPEFDALNQHMLREIMSGLSKDSIVNDPVLNGFRDLHAAVGKSNRKNIASPENLLSMLLHTGRLPRVNLLVDIYNLISVKSRIALGSHDTEHIAGNVHLRLTKGTERFLPLGATEVKAVAAGEYAYVDDDNDIICRLETRQVEKTKVTLQTTECFYIAQGNANTTEELLKASVDELLTLTKRFCGGKERMIYAP